MGKRNDGLDICSRREKPLALTNGEFGNRLAAQLSACRRDAGIADFGFGNPIGEAQLRKVIEENPEADLIFCVACETSWGGLTDLRMLSRIARERGITICLDAMSAVGFSPEIFSFPNIVAISASSGKGLASLPGIAVLFIDSEKRFLLVLVLVYSTCASTLPLRKPMLRSTR